jgi:hypothetical protein
LDNLIRLGYSQIRIGQSEIGMVNLHRGIDLARSTGLGVVEIRGLQFLSYSYLFLHEWGLALKVAEQLENQANKRSMPLVREIARYVGGIARSNLGRQQDILEHMQLILTSLEEIGQPFIEIRTLVHLIRIKRSLKLDPGPDIRRAKEILAKCEDYAHPAIVNQAFLDFKKSVLNQISI